MTIAWKVLAAAAAAAALLSGCSSVSLDEGAKEGTLAGNQAAQQQTVQDPFTDPSNPLSHRSVYFAFDSYEVSPEYAAIVEAHAKWLAEHPNVKIVIQGNTDERAAANTTSRSARSVLKPCVSACSFSASRATALRRFPSARKSLSLPATRKRPGLRTAVPTSFIRKARAHRPSNARGDA